MLATVAKCHLKTDILAFFGYTFCLSACYGGTSKPLCCLETKYYVLYLPLHDWSKVLLLSSGDRQIHVSFSHYSVALCNLYSHHGQWAMSSTLRPSNDSQSSSWLKTHQCFCTPQAAKRPFLSSQQKAWKQGDRSLRQSRQTAKKITSLTHYTQRFSPK